MGAVLVLRAVPKFKFPVPCVLLVNDDTLKFVGAAVDVFDEIFVKLG